MADIRTTTKVEGPQASDLPVSDNPVIIGGRASNAVPTAVSADGDAVQQWMNRSGAKIVSEIPHVGLMSDPFVLASVGAQYTTTQTSAVLVSIGASDRIVVTKLQIQTAGTTVGDVQVYFGTGAFARGSSRAIFDGHFDPSATFSPGVVMDGPFIAASDGDDLLVTTSAAINPLTVNVWYYTVT